VLVGSTRTHAEKRPTVPITRNPGAAPRVVLSLKREGNLADLPSIHAGDRIEPVAELQVTTDCRPGHASCVGRPYDFAPNVQARLLLADSARARVPDPSHAIELGTAQSLKCTHRRHHCMFVFRNIAEAITLANHPCRGGDSCHLNLVVDAWHSKSRRDDVILIGENEPGLDPPVDGNRARVAAVRVRPSDAIAGKGLSPETDHRSAIPVQSADRRVIFSKPLGIVRRRAQFKVDFQMTAVPPGAYPARLSTQVIITDGPNSVTPIRQAAYLSGRATPFNGTNCVNGEPCTIRKAGVMRVTRNLHRGLYFNVVADAGDPRHRATRGDQISITKGSLDVRAYAPALRG
jgi:hypothetical protein